MRSKPQSRKFLLVLGIVTCLSFGLVAWDFKQTPPENTKQTITDTVPREKKIKDLDDVLIELNSIDINQHMEKAMKEMEESLKKLDASRIRMDIERSLKEVDFKKIEQDIAKAMKEIDAAKIQVEIESALAKVDFDKIEKELKAVKEVDMKKIEEEMKKVQVELKELGPKLKVELEQAKVEIEKAKTEIKEYKAFVDGLENDGLIEKNKYSIEHKNGELLINGKKQGSGVYNKYKTFLDKHKKFSITKTEDDFNIDNDDDD